MKSLNPSFFWLLLFFRIRHSVSLHPQIAQIRSSSEPCEIVNNLWIDLTLASISMSKIANEARDLSIPC
jgi:hypothetical protein